MRKTITKVHTNFLENFLQVPLRAKVLEKLEFFQKVTSSYKSYVIINKVRMK